MRSGSRLGAIAVLAAALVATAAPGARAQTVDLRKLFTSAPQGEAVPTGEDVLRRALDNLFGFDASITIQAKRREANGSTSTSEFLVERRRAQGARRLLVVSVKPANVRGTRVLQINYDDGREETYAYVPLMGGAMGGEPMRARYRLAEPFLATWYEIGEEETPMELLALGEYEVLGMEPGVRESEPIYKVRLRPLAGRGYDWTELLIAKKDYAILEHRHYFAGGQNPALIGVAPRGAMVRFGDRLVPQRMRYRDTLENAEIEVTLNHAQLTDSSDALFFPRTFHRFPLAILDRTN